VPQGYGRVMGRGLAGSASGGHSGCQEDGRTLGSLAAWAAEGTRARLPPVKRGMFDTSLVSARGGVTLRRCGCGMHAAPRHCDRQDDNKWRSDRPSTTDY
jgi:hypothetical protein